MEKNKKALLLRCVAYSFVLILGISFAVGGYVYTVIGELKLKIDQTRLSKKANELFPSKLEKDSQVWEKDLKTYLLFSSHQNSNQFYKDLIANKQLFESGKKVKITEDVDLDGLEENTCQKVLCVQIKKSFPEIPSTIWKGLLGTEDFRFLEHRGVDIWAIGRAIVVDIIAMKFVQGGSTLTQQLMKNLFLTNERKLSRKIKEMIYAIYIENILEKEEIVTLYLNEMFWGVHQGIYLKGFYAASLAYFQKSPRKLNDYEATILVSLLKGPGYYDPRKGFERLKTRSDAVYKRLQGLNLVSKKENYIWSERKWRQFHEGVKARDKEKNYYTYYLVSKNTDLHLESFEKVALLASYLKHNSRLQERSKNADVAVKILISDKSCESYDCKNLFSFYSKIEREKRRAIVGEFHQVGSLFKPIVYDSFIDLGRSYDEVISTDPVTLELKSGKWTPKDYSKAKSQFISLKEALQKSKNIPLVKVASEIGFDKLEMALEERIPRLKKPLAEYPAQLLGALELSLEEVFSSYGEFLQEKCNEVSSGKLKFEQSVLYYMSLADQTTISKLARGPYKNALIFGKTGTSNNGLDNWYVAYDGTQIYVFWYGVESERDKVNIRMSGGVSSFLMFQEFINYRGKQVSEVYCQNDA